MTKKIDIDAGYDPTNKEHGTLDEYRQTRMKAVEQPGFGKAAMLKKKESEQSPPVVDEQEDSEVIEENEVTSG